MQALAVRPPRAMADEILPDDRLVPRALEGDREAWSALIARHDRRVVLTLIARGVRADRARELAQETWEKLVTQQQAGHLKWIELPGLAIRQAIFLAIDDARRRYRDVPMDDAPEIALLTDPAPTAEERMLSRADADRALDVLAACSPGARRVFELVYENPGVPHAEAARRAGISVQRVRQTLCEIRAKVRAALENDR
jgi:RNA polymerase sigma-70 factor (ECF subfamily)